MNKEKLTKEYIKKLISHIGFMSWEILYKYDEEYHTDETRWGGKLLNKCHFVYAYYMTEVMGWEEPEYYQNDEEIASGYWNREKYALESDKERYIQNIIDNLTAAYKTLDIYKADPLNGQFISHDEEKEAEHIKMMEYFRDNLVLGPSPDREVNDKPSREQIKNLIKIVNNIKEAVAFASMSSPFGLDNYAKKQIQEIESIKFPLFFAWGAYHYGDSRSLVPQEFGYQWAYESFTLSLEEQLQHNINYLETNRFMNSQSMHLASYELLITLKKIQSDLVEGKIRNL